MSNTTSTESSTDALWQRQLLHRLRADLRIGVVAIVGQSQVLSDDAHANEYPGDALDDLKKLLEASKELYHFVKENIDAMWPEVGNSGFGVRLRRTRHDCRNLLNHALGPCQFLLMREREDFFGAMTDELESIKSACEMCLTTLDRYQDADSGDDAVGFTLGLPESRPTVPDLTARVRHRLPDSQTNVPSAILVADDNEDNRNLLAQFLTSQGHKVGTASDGRETLAVLNEDDFDLVLLDLEMPEMGGFDVLDAMRADGRLQHTPVIIVSGLSDVEHVVTCIEMGAEDHLPKPVDFKLLKARLDSCLEKRRLREREFAQFFTPELARHYVRHPELLKKGVKADVTVMFCDIRGFSSISQRLDPTDTVSWLSDVMGTFSDCVIHHQGVLVDYIGDELMAMWGAPEEHRNHAELACRAAVSILEQLPELDRRWRRLVKVPTDVGIGINSGTAQVGNTGTDRKFKYGPLGDTVNVASRVQGATKYVGTNLLVTESTHKQVQDKFPVRRLCKVRVVNIDRPVELFEIRPQSQNLSARLRNGYERALLEAENQDLTSAAATLGRLLADAPQDGPALLLMSRIVDVLLQHRPKFDPVWELPGK